MIDLFTLTQLVQHAGEAAVANYIKHTQPASDKLKMREAYRWVATLGIKPCELDEMISKGIVGQTRNGNGKNSPVIVSKTEIMQAIVAKKIGILID